MFLLDQSFGALLTLNFSNDPSCVSDYVPSINYTQIDRMNTYHSSSCERFYFKAYGKKYLTNETIYFTRNYSSSGNFTIVGSFNNLNNIMIDANKMVLVYRNNQNFDIQLLNIFTLVPLKK